MKKPLLIISVSVCLYGCGETDISKVKNTSIDSSNSTTYGELLDNRSVCDSTQWTSYKEKDDIFVGYRCDLHKNSILKPYIKEAEKELKGKTEINEYRESHIDKYFEKITWVENKTTNQYDIKGMTVSIVDGFGKEYSNVMCLKDVISMVSEKDPESYFSNFLLVAAQCSINKTQN